MTTAETSQGPARADDTADDTVDVPVRLDFDTRAPGFAAALAHLDRAAVKELDRAKVDPPLRELLRLRASQLNGCAYCVDMHTRDARAGGESEQRLYALTVWPDTPFFTARERAALAFTEAVTLMADGHVPDAAYEAVAAQFSPDEVAALLALVVAVNAWNAVGVATHTWRPGSYEP
jgi:AhpD family alkylhydroperoxidase